MKFYHYTSVPLVEAIFDLGLSKGHIQMSNGEIVQPIVWLTTDPSSEGHGLLTGEEKLDDKQLAYLTRVQGAQPRNRFTHNKEQIRIEVDGSRLTEAPKRYVDVCREIGEPAVWSKMMGLSCFYTSSELEQMEDAAVMHLMQTKETKEGTWFLSTEIDPSAFSNVSFNSASGFVDYDFELHGRPGLENSGIAVADPAVLSSLREIIEPAHPYDTPKAVVVVTDPDSSPKCAIRCYAMQFVTEIMKPDAEVAFVGDRPDNLSEIKSWISANQEHLMKCHERAKTARARYYPPPA